MELVPYISVAICAPSFMQGNTEPSIAQLQLAGDGFLF